MMMMNGKPLIKPKVEKVEEVKKASGGPKGMMMKPLDLGKMADARDEKPMDFQDEFMAKVDEFSQSWRDALQKKSGQH